MDKTTYIVGAGFSRYAKLPLMNDFYFHSKDIFSKLTEESDKASFQNIFKYFDEYSKVKHIMNADFYNIEELLSIIEMDYFINGDQNIYKDYLIYLKKVIELSLPTQETADGDLLIERIGDTSLYSDFMKSVYGIKLNDAQDYYDRDSQNENGIISLNYDLLLEKSLRKFNKKNFHSLGSNYKSYDFDYGLDEKYIQYTCTSQPRYKKLKLAKIHGSINFTDNELPIIIPPTWNKTSNLKMQSVWKFAHNMISESNNLVFIGYSLPETDLYVKYLLISGIKMCDNLKKILVICLDDENKTVQKRYENFFDSNYRSKAFEFVSKTFEEWRGKPKPKVQYYIL